VTADGPAYGLNARAALVERADPARFCAAMAARFPDRRVLFPLYGLQTVALPICTSVLQLCRRATDSLYI